MPIANMPAITNTHGVDDDDDNMQETPPTPEEITYDPELRCRYSSKYCIRKRTIKRGGKLHKFCEFHRQKANRNQRRLENRKRIQKLKEQADQRAMELYYARCGYPINLSPSIHATARSIARQSPSTSTPRPQQISIPLYQHSTLSLAPMPSSHQVIDFPTTEFESPRQVDVMIHTWEPFYEPTQLHPEDIEAVQSLADEDDAAYASILPEDLTVTHIEVSYHHHQHQSLLLEPFQLHVPQSPALELETQGSRLL